MSPDDIDWLPYEGCDLDWEQVGERRESRDRRRGHRQGRPATRSR